MYGAKFSRVMHTRVHLHFEKVKLYHDKQYGFREKHCTVDAIAEMIEQMREKKTKM